MFTHSNVLIKESIFLLSSHQDIYDSDWFTMTKAIQQIFTLTTSPDNINLYIDTQPVLY
jgi:hypothetical protein